MGSAKRKLEKRAKYASASTPMKELAALRTLG
jgi:hypothetical protein